MKPQPITQAELDEIAGQSIAADVEAVRRDMSSQFQDPYECFRELVVNASDAGAEHVTVRVSDRDDEHYEVEITDDGHGMTGEALRDMSRCFGRRRSVIWGG